MLDELPDDPIVGDRLVAIIIADDPHRLQIGPRVDRELLEAVQVLPTFAVGCENWEDLFPVLLQLIVAHIPHPLPPTGLCRMVRAKALIEADPSRRLGLGWGVCHPLVAVLFPLPGFTDPDPRFFHLRFAEASPKCPLRLFSCCRRELSEPRSREVLAAVLERHSLDLGGLELAEALGGVGGLAVRRKDAVEVQLEILTPRTGSPRQVTCPPSEP